MIGVRPMLIVPLERLFESKVRLQDMASAGKRRTLPRNLLSSDAGLHLGLQFIREVRKLLLLCVDEIAIVSIQLVGALHEGHVACCELSEERFPFADDRIAWTTVPQVVVRKEKRETLVDR